MSKRETVLQHGWFVLTADAASAVRIGPGTRLGEDAAGELSFDPAHAQVEFDFGPQGELMITAVSEHIVLEQTPSDRKQALTLRPDARGEIEFAHGVVKVAEDFIVPRRVEDVIRIRVLDLATVVSEPVEASGLLWLLPEEETKPESQAGMRDWPATRAKGEPANQPLRPVMTPRRRAPADQSLWPGTARAYALFLLVAIAVGLAFFAVQNAQRSAAPLALAEADEAPADQADATGETETLDSVASRPDAGTSGSDLAEMLAMPETPAEAVADIAPEITADVVPDAFEPPGETSASLPEPAVAEPLAEPATPFEEAPIQTAAVEAHAEELLDGMAAEPVPGSVAASTTDQPVGVSDADAADLDVGQPVPDLLPDLALLTVAPPASIASEAAASVDPVAGPETESAQSLSSPEGLPEPEPIAREVAIPAPLEAVGSAAVVAETQPEAQPATRLTVDDFAFGDEATTDLSGAVLTGVPGLEAIAAEVLAAADAAEFERDLRNADLAVVRGVLMPPQPGNAFGLYLRALDRRADSQRARAGLEAVTAALLARARALLESDDLEAARSLLVDADLAGADPARTGALRAEADYRQHILEAETGAFTRLYELSELEVVDRPLMEYPRYAPRGAEGVVEMEMTVSADGEVVDIDVAGDPPRYFERAARRYVQRWKFAPHTVNGKPVPVRTAVRVVFQG